MKMKGISSLYEDRNAGSFLTGMLMFGVAAGLFSGVLNNYLYEILSISRLERGIIEFPRELPGLLLFLIIALFARFAELRIMHIALLTSALGLSGLGFFGDSRFPAIVLIVLWSAGEHIMMPIRDSVGMHMAKPGKEGRAMGGVSSLMNLGQVAGSYLIPVLFFLIPAFSGAVSRFSLYRTVFFAGGVVLLITLILSTRVPLKDRHLRREKLRFQKKYRKYYILEVFFGARKQVFLTFAPYVLIVNYGASTEFIATLYGVWSMMNIFVAPLVGKLIDRFGFKKIIVADAVVLVILCLLYGYSHLLFPGPVAFTVVTFVFVLDAVLFLVSMARSMYVKSVSDNRNETTSALSTGISINHLVSIIIAVLGGLLWERLGMETLFTIAAVFGTGSFLFSLTIPGPELVLPPEGDRKKAVQG